MLYYITMVNTGRTIRTGLGDEVFVSVSICPATYPQIQMY